MKTICECNHCGWSGVSADPDKWQFTDCPLCGREGIVTSNFTPEPEPGSPEAYLAEIRHTLGKAPAMKRELLKVSRNLSKFSRDLKNVHGRFEASEGDLV